MVIKGGTKAAADMLSGLGSKERDKVIKLMNKKDSNLAEQIVDEMVVFEDLQNLTANMIQDLLREITIDDLGVALRIGSHELRDHFFKNISKGNGQEIRDILNGPKKSLKDINEATLRIMKVVKEKVERGEIILNRDHNDTYV